MATDFWEHGYVVADAMMNADQLTFARHAMEASMRSGRLQPSTTSRDPREPLNEYSAIGAEAMLVQCQSSVEAITNCQLIPTYARWRVYETGAVLRRHVDRDSCEVSVSLPILADTTYPPWPIHIRSLGGEERAVSLIPGSGVVYQGCRVDHWREPLRGHRQYQVFLHYVVKGGERARHAFDGRDRLAIDAADDLRS